MHLQIAARPFDTSLNHPSTHPSRTFLLFIFFLQILCLYATLRVVIDLPTEQASRSFRPIWALRLVSRVLVLDLEIGGTA